MNKLKRHTLRIVAVQTRFRTSILSTQSKIVHLICRGLSSDFQQASMLKALKCWIGQFVQKSMLIQSGTPLIVQTNKQTNKQKTQTTG